MTGYRPSVLSAGLRARCPRCGQGRLFSGFLSVADCCDSCGLDYEFADAGDGPAIFIIFIVGFVVVGLALVTEVVWSPSIFVHLLLWLPLTLALSLWLMRPLKATMIALQYAHDAREGRS